MAVLMLALQQPEKRVARILGKVLRDETDAKMRLHASWGLKRYDEALRARQVDAG